MRTVAFQQQYALRTTQTNFDKFESSDRSDTYKRTGCALLPGEVGASIRAESGKWFTGGGERTAALCEALFSNGEFSTIETLATATRYSKFDKQVRFPRIHQRHPADPTGRQPTSPWLQPSRLHW